MNRQKIWGNADDIFKDIADKVVDSVFERSELAKMLCFLDPEHSIIVDSNIGLIGEFKGKHISKNSHTIKNVVDEEKCGDVYTVIGKQGLIILEEKVTHSYMILDETLEAFEYLFIIENASVQDELSDFFDMDSTIPAVVIYNVNTEEYRTNCLDLANKYKYDKGIDITSTDASNNGILNIMYNGNCYYGCEINTSNHIGILKASK